MDRALRTYYGLARTHHDTFFYCPKSRDYQGARKKAGKTGDFQGGKEKGGKTGGILGKKAGKTGDFQGEARDYQGKSREKAGESRGKQGKARGLSGKKPGGNQGIIRGKSRGKSRDYHRFLIIPLISELALEGLGGALPFLSTFNKIFSYNICLKIVVLQYSWGETFGAIYPD